ncbi:CpsD/CapB family tyrosine-protein kinase [Fictibacillus barbaricus]|uniref:non-specific protein-tyrosine kinase n=1 Tax=Fictibacillus barbaricus TaxID=182136 RepID=A0ABU1U1N1_9BACL|nr:CpsD/CapB family tyrosine-protein kinase [Fictibacillus barbaricus]MDR7073376.1 capsular exopolysaccharide synthesis family protein [Fictibacillus barbaricus]
MGFKKNNPVAAKMRSLLSYTNPYSSIAEQYRSTRTNLYFLTKKGGRKILLVTSPRKGAGKTTTLVNLAISMVKGNEKVLIIDANFRNPSIHTILKLQNRRGLIDVIKGIQTFENAVHQTYIEGLDVLTSGDTRTSALEELGTTAMTELLEILSNKYDAILIDAPSVLEAAEARFLASKSDGVILITNKFVTKIEEIVKTQKALEVAKANIIGVVLNEKNNSWLEEYFF